MRFLNHFTKRFGQDDGIKKVKITNDNSFKPILVR